MTMGTRRAVVLAGGGVLLGGCGFKLRQPPKLGFETIRSPGNFATPVARELMRALEQAGVRVLPPEPPRQPGLPPPPSEPVDVVLDVLADQRERAVVGITATGQVRELQLLLKYLRQQQCVQ